MKTFARGRHIAWSISLVLVLLRGSAIAAPPPTAGPPKPLADTLSGPAKQDYDDAILLSKDGDYAGALIKFRSAFETTKDPRLLWNVAACEKLTRRYARAIEHLRLYRADTTGLVTDREKSEAAALITTFEPFTIAVAIEVNEPDAEVEIDDDSLGRSPLAPMVVDLGQHKFRVRKAGFHEIVRHETIGEQTQQTIVFKLVREIHEGKVSVRAPRNALILIDEKTIGNGRGSERVDLVLSAGPHNIRVTSEGMRVYDHEIIVRENETRNIDVVLEAQPEAPKSEVRIGVGCIDSAPVHTIRVYFDGAPDAAQSLGGKKAWSAETKQEQLEYISYAIASGEHRVLVQAPGCEPAEATIHVAPGTGADVRGALRSSASFVGRGPAGNPDWGRVAVALWMPSTIGTFEKPAVSTSSAPALDGAGYSPSGTGLILQPGLVSRWWTASLDFAYAAGSASLSRRPISTNAAIVQRLEAVEAKWVRAGLRLGFRLPLYQGALSFGVGAGYDDIALTKMAPGMGWDEGRRGYMSGWALAELYVLCDLPLHFGMSFDAGFTGNGPIAQDSTTTAFQIGAAFQPNRQCRAAESTKYEITQPGRGAASR